MPTIQAAKVDASKLPPPVDRKIDFVKDIQPIFANHCYECHGPKKQEHDLRLDQKTTASKGGESGPAFVAGKSAASLLHPRSRRIKSGFGPDAKEALPAYSAEKAA